MRDINEIPERFWKKVDRSGGPDACWPWLAATVSGGYPIYRNDVDRSVRWYLWFLLYGALPARGIVISCRLDTVSCVNPLHFISRTPTERIKLAITRGTFYSPFTDCSVEQRTEYADAAKASVDSARSRHLFTDEQRARGHASRGCVPGGVGPRFGFDLPRRERRILLSDPCVYCYEVAEELDHIEPFSRGGSHDWSNRAPACLRCNRVKNDKKLLPFLIKQQQERASHVL